MTQLTYINPETGEIMYPTNDELEEWGYQYGYYPQTGSQVNTNKVTAPIKEDGWEQVDDEHFLPVVKDRLLAFMSRLLINSRGTEITGNFYLDPGSQEIVYISKGDGDGNAGHVVLSADKAASRHLRDKEKFSQTPNGQWHSHPNMGAFWSITDRTDQAKDLQMARVFHKKGERYFIVVSGLEWLIRRYRWDDAKGIKEYAETHVYMENGGQLLGTKSYTYNYSTRWQRDSYRPAAAVADDPVLGEVTDLDGVAKMMRADPNLHKKLSSDESTWIFKLVWDEYGDLHDLKQALGVVTTAEALNIIFSHFRLQPAKAILSDRSTWPKVKPAIDRANAERYYDKGSEHQEAIVQVGKQGGGDG